jgi:hypothetical protein
MLVPFCVSFGSWACVILMLIYIPHSVESQGRTIEQLEWVYNQPRPVKASLKVDKVVIEADGRVVEKIESD